MIEYKNILAVPVMAAALLTGGSSIAALPFSSGKEVPTLAPLLEQVLPAVVHIETQATVIVRRNLPFPFREFFDMPQRENRRQQRSGAGSGVIIDAEKGHLITNNHVVDKAENIVVTLHDNRRFEAEVIGKDPDTDIAILKIEADKLHRITFGDSDKLRVGDFVLAIGNPFGLEQSVTSGIVSALGRSGLGIESYEDFIQTDASINPGNSGGALINLKGELVGINTAILGPSGGNIGIGFAIPINMALDITQQLLEYGSVKRGRLGVTVQSLTPDLAQAFGVQRSYGAVITSIEEHSAADEAGLKPGDIVLSINNEKVTNASDMRNFIGLLRADTRISLKVLRDEEELVVVATIREPQKMVVAGNSLHKKLNGVVLQNVGDSDKPYRQDGILVRKLNTNSLAYQAGLRETDLILAANRARVKTIKDLEQAVENEPVLLLKVQRNRRSLFLIIR